ncbi:IclR family transcriptional regulator [Sphingobium lignivorans]|uniref:DNA-binding IclR family transcriptional regulator n=1 Tax=Sphingobium lignivorans TaxID=2735886 RepID=A0ABR6NF00_9SPHN|nr:IclR family transcriptional regulator [Sphingobium lignivorans]MBB5985088.1 DNA-binding IclR family transcriptional regulator [Sphingobium lignivorans]
MNSKAGVAAVDRAFDILHAFSREKPVLTLAEISRSTGLYKSTILRLMGSLEKYGFVWQRADGNYQLGPGLLSLASIFQDSFSLREFVEPVLEELVTATNEGATFFIDDGNEQLCLFRVDGRHAIRDYNIRVGDRRPMNNGAAATIFRRFTQEPGLALTPETFMAESFGSVEPEMAALATPVFGVNNALMGVLTLSGPITRFNPEHAEGIKPALVEASIRLSISLGASPARFAALRGG